jgi:protease-4
MKKFFLGFVIGLLFAALVGTILVFAAMRLGQRSVSVADGSTLVLHLEGDMPEQAPVEVQIPFLQPKPPMTVEETWRTLQKAAADPRIKALVLEPEDLSAGWPKLQELRSDVVAFKKSGKPVYAYLRGATSREYYVATAADAIYMTPEDELDVKGLRAQLLYLKGTLDKLGVMMEFDHIGKYKDAPDQYTKTGPSPETLEVTNQILDQYYGDIVDKIAEGRKKTPDAVRALIDQGPFVGQEAVSGGLVDGLLYEDQMYDKLKDRLKADIKKITGRDYARAPLSGFQGKTRIAFLTGEGDITRGGSLAGIPDNGITATGMVKLMQQLENDSSIKGVIFRIDSPGGDGIASDDILHEAQILSRKKPMVISMSDDAASGGYFIAMTGDPIVAYPDTLTGSIGVFYGKANIHGLLDKLGINIATLKRGKFADIDSMDSPLNDEERAKLHTEIETFYKSFVQRVADGRKRKYDQIEPLAQGRVWLGEQAKQNGLVDQTGGLDEALALIKGRLGLAAAEKVTLVTYPPKRSLFDLIFRQGDEDLDSEVAAKLRPLMGRLPLRALAEGGILRLMPFTVEVK